MRLHDFITAHRDQILEEFAVFACSCTPAARAMDIGALRDHASEMIDAVIADLQSEQTAAHQKLKALGERDAPRTLGADAEGGTAAQSHGAGRARSGFTIEQLVSEHRALRASVLRLWLLGSSEADGAQIEDLMRFNEAIDQALVESVSSFARVVESALREARAQLEKRVEDRTRQLARMNEELLAQIKQRERAEEIRIRLLQQVVKAQEDEQRRIARELHDQMGQQITALGLKVRALTGDDGLQPRLRHEIENVQKIVQQLDQDVDFLVWQLRPTALDDLGLVEAISDYVNNWSRHTGVSAKLYLTGMDGKRLSAEVETVLYRVTQEALNNVAKHAAARNVRVGLEHGPDATVLTVTDDGTGFDLKRQRRDGTTHFGLDGMTERAALVGGTLSVEGRPGHGTTVSVRIPVVSELASAGDRC
jgi:signal transduction histidine kinase